MTPVLDVEKLKENIKLMVIVQDVYIIKIKQRKKHGQKIQDIKNV